MKKAKQRLVNASAQVAQAEANMTVENVVGPLNTAARPATGPSAEGGGSAAAPSSASVADAASTGRDDGAESAGDADGAPVSPQQAVLPPIYLALAISVNFAADYQKNNRNVVERD